MKNAVIYCRVATEKQLDSPTKNAVIYIRVRAGYREQTALINKQLEACKRLAEEKGYSVVHTYIESEIFGVKSERTVQAQLLKDSKTQSWNTVIVFSIDRISRDLRYLERYRKQLARNGKTLLTVDGYKGENKLLTVIPNYIKGVKI